MKVLTFICEEDERNVRREQADHVLHEVGGAFHDDAADVRVRPHEFGVVHVDDASFEAYRPCAGLEEVGEPVVLVHEQDDRDLVGRAEGCGMGERRAEGSVRH